MKRYLHIKYGNYKLIGYEFTDECMCFNLISELEITVPNRFNSYGITIINKGYVSVDLDVFLKQTCPPMYGMLPLFIEQVNTIEKRSKLIKKILE